MFNWLTGRGVVHIGGAPMKDEYGDARYSVVVSYRERWFRWYSARMDPLTFLLVAERVSEYEGDTTLVVSIPVEGKKMELVFPDWVLKNIRPAMAAAGQAMYQRLVHVDKHKDEIIEIGVKMGIMTPEQVKGVQESENSFMAEYQRRRAEMFPEKITNAPSNETVH